MDTMEDFPWKDNAQVRSAYEMDNYLISETGNATGRAIIFFSSNGIYYPNDEETFVKYIAKENDGFEWFHLAQHRRIQKYFQKIIFVRDIYKQWYVTGINVKINTVDKVQEFLRKEVEGLSVFTCGGSAGGYAAVLFGTLLHAECIFANSAQFLLLSNKEYGPFVEAYADDPERSKYYDLVPLLQGRSNVFYNYPVHCANDVFQYDHVKNIRGLSIMKIDSAIHGGTFDGICWPFLLTMENDALLMLYQKYEGKIIRGKAIRKEVVPAVDLMFYLLRKLSNKLKRR